MSLTNSDKKFLSETIDQKLDQRFDEQEQKLSKKFDEQEQKFVGLISDALNDVMVPALESMEQRLTDKLASKVELKELSMQVDSLSRKFDAQQERQDRDSQRIEALENIHPKGKHSLVTA